MNNTEDRGTVKWGILGCARIAANALIPGMMRSSNCEVSAIASRSRDKAEEFAERFGIPCIYENYEQLLSDPEIQAVYIPLPNALHKPWTIAAAEKAKHVLCEKPLACNAEEAQQMRSACEQNGVLLMEAFAQRFHPQNHQVKQLIDSGRIGKIVRITSSMSRSPYPQDDIRMNKDLCGGVLMDMGCYCISTARFFVGTEPNSVFATQDMSEGGVDIRTTATVVFPAGEILQFDTNLYLSEGHFEQGTTVYGQSGNIYIQQGFSQVETHRFGKLVETPLVISDHLVGAQASETIRITPVHQWQLEAEYFADCILQNRRIDYPGEDGVANMRVIDAIVRSARAGKSVDLR
ncbi:MAG: Gfo/Idh/MocA family oxidoreductase [Spirochaetaceae bacterium]|nr:MAG: Gfo/Idh/MocA family oxidoreductase [Spirochaetaceae bacterium]